MNKNVEEFNNNVKFKKELTDIQELVMKKTKELHKELKEKYPKHITVVETELLPEEGRALTIDTHSNVYITGTVNLHHSDIFMLKLNKDFNLLWNETWGGDLTEKPNDIGFDQEGNIYVVGETVSFGSGDYDLFLGIYDQNNARLKISFWGDVNDDRGDALLFKANNDLYLGGYSTNINTSIKEMVLLKLPYVPIITDIIGPGYSMWLVIGIVIIVLIFTVKKRSKYLSLRKLK